MQASVDRLELIEILEDNRAKHRAIFEEAVEGYRNESIRQLEKYIERIKKGSLKRIYVSLPEPSDHTGDYDTILGMLSMSEDKLIRLDPDTYRQYVLDDWSWKRQFITTNAAYSVTAASAADALGDD